LNNDYLVDGATTLGNNAHRYQFCSEAGPISMHKSIFSLNHDCKIHTYKVGREGEPLLQADEYLADIDLLRDYAIRNNQFSQADTYYPGIRMPISFNYTMSLAKHFQGYIEDTFGLSLSKVKRATSSYSIVTATPASLGLRQRIPHFDAPSRNSLAMIHYLCNAPDSGTALYRHRQSTFEYIDEKRNKQYVQHIDRQFDNPLKHPQGYICGDTDNFEMLQSFSAVYNRVLMYRGSSLHSGIIRPDFNLDPSPETGRLTITTFIEFRD